MEKIILGLLMVRGLTIYEMKIFINKNLDTMCSNSSGSIHTAINKMLDKELISYKEVENKKIYYILSKGREEFNQWILQPMDHTKAKNIELSKMFFLGLSDPSKRKDLIMKYIEKLKEEQVKLKLIYDNITKNMEDIIMKGIEVVGNDPWNDEGIKKNIYADTMKDTISDLYMFQLTTLEYGMESIEFEINWYTKITTNL